MDLVARRFEAADEVRRFDHGRLEVVGLAGQQVGLATFDPGWRWSLHVRPVAASSSCQVHHIGYLLSGRLAVRMDDGTEAVAGPRDLVSVPAGHDGWVVGESPCVMLDWGGTTTYAR